MLVLSIPPLFSPSLTSHVMDGASHIIALHASTSRFTHHYISDITLSAGSRCWAPDLVSSCLATSISSVSEGISAHISAVRTRSGGHVAHDQRHDWGPRLASSSSLLLSAHATLPWFNQDCGGGAAGVVLAGGAVASMVCTGDTPPGDADLFIVMPGSSSGGGRSGIRSKEETSKLLEDVAELSSRTLMALQRAASAQRLFSYVEFSSTHLTFLALRCPLHTTALRKFRTERPGEDPVAHKVQLILRVYSTPAQVGTRYCCDPVSPHCL